MKKLCIAILIAAAGLQLQAQENKYIPKEQDWFFYDLTYLSYLDAPEGVEMNGWSNGHSLSFMRDLLLGNSNFSIGYGLGYTSNNYKSNLDQDVSEATGATRFSIHTDMPDDNKLNIKYFEIPIELRFRTRPNDEGNFFRLYLGARGGIRFSAYHKYETDNISRKEFHHEELNRWRAGVYTRIGYGLVSVYGYYGLLDIFDYSHDPVANDLNVNGINSLAVGLSIGI